MTHLSHRSRSLMVGLMFSETLSTGGLVPGLTTGKGYGLTQKLRSSTLFMFFSVSRWRICPLLKDKRLDLRLKGLLTSSLASSSYRARGHHLPPQFRSHLSSTIRRNQPKANFDPKSVRTSESASPTIIPGPPFAPCRLPTIIFALSDTRVHSQTLRRKGCPT